MTGAGALWAVHIADGVLSEPWLAGGFVAAAALLLLGAWRIRDDEIPRTALLAAAFFVASLIHVRIGPTSVHLLLNGLLGVVLGRRAALALPVALALQAGLIQHGGYTALGVNACVLTLPALVAGGLFHLLHRPLWLRGNGYRTALVIAAAVSWGLAAAFSVALLATNGSVGQTALDPGPAVRLTFHPVTLAGVVLFAGALAWVERRLENQPEFPLGLLLGVGTVLLTTTLNAAALLWGGAEDWRLIVLLGFVAHLPIAAVEGLVLGFTLGFLARVKPELLGSSPAGVAAPAAESAPASGAPAPAFMVRPPALLLAAAALLATAAPARAHKLDAEYKVRPDGTVRVEAWFDLADDAPAGAKVQVHRADKSLLAEGQLDAQGVYVFRFETPEDLRVTIDAGAGHRAVLRIPARALGAGPAGHAAQREEADGDALIVERPRRGWTEERLKDVVLGVGALLAVAAFVMSWRNARAIRELRGKGGPP